MTAAGTSKGSWTLTGIHISKGATADLSIYAISRAEGKVLHAPSYILQAVDMVLIYSRVLSGH